MISAPARTIRRAPNQRMKEPKNGETIEPRMPMNEWPSSTASVLQPNSWRIGPMNTPEA